MPQTKAGMIEQCRSMSQENARVWEALIATQCGADVTVGRFTADNWHVTVKLINPTRAHGGIVLISSKDDDGNSSGSSAECVGS